MTEVEKALEVLERRKGHIPHEVQDATRPFAPPCEKPSMGTSPSRQRATNRFSRRRVAVPQEKWKRWRGHGVPAFCDHVGCDAKITAAWPTQGVAHECRCDKFYCAAHRYDVPRHTHDAPPSREHPAWAEHVLTHESWRQWRE
ncbi:MAG: hypothetical protein ABN502_09720 [Gammaproteobacteria bacterium]